MQKQRITVEEYQQIKRRLFALRRQYARLLYRLPYGVPSNQQAARLRKLERRMARIELQLAHSELDLPEEEPVTLRDFFYEIGFYLRRAWLMIRRNDADAAESQI